MQEDKNIEEYVEVADFDKENKRSWKEKFWDFIGGKYFVPVAIILVAVISFSLGRLSGLEEKREPVRIISETAGEVKGSSINNDLTDNTKNSVAPANALEDQGGSVVASKNGTKYHYPWCAGAKQISDKNKITFQSIEAARAAGYLPASNCKGLK